MAGEQAGGGIQRVAVLGAGVMGSGIAAHLANAGAEVTLLDIVPEPARGLAPGAAERNAIASAALQRMLNTLPAPFMSPGHARRVSVGNLDDDLERLGAADWIIEAVVERLDVKRDLYRRVDAVRRPGSTVSSNTSTIPLSELVAGQSEAFQRDFMITHFFNPPRYMRLLELVGGERTRADALDAMRAFCDRKLGKGVVDCKDTPGFIGNRIGVYWMQVAVLEAMRLGLSVEEADAVAGRPMGVPKTGVFALFDLVGIDLMPHVLESMRSLLPAGDAFHEHARVPELITRMIETGYTGRKGKGGFYRLHRDGARRVKQGLDLTSGEYRDSVKADLECLRAAREGGLRALVEHPDRGGRYAWSLLSSALVYAAGLVPAIADAPEAVDRAMQLGFNWARGPFALIDELGAGYLAERLASEQRAVPELLARAGAQGGFFRVHEGRREGLAPDGRYRRLSRPPGVLRLADLKLASQRIAGNASASLWDVGEGVACLEFHSKMNSIDEDILALVEESVSIVPRAHRALVIHNEAENFSVGVNLGLALFAANTAAWDAIERLVRMGQHAYGALRGAPFPVVGAPAGMALGGGCEVLLHCDAVEAHAETYMGLVEVGVGLIPAWGGCTRLLERWQANPRRPGGPMPPVMQAFETISLAKVSRSADEARSLLLLRPGDGIVMNRDRVLAAARERAVTLSEGYRAPEAHTFALPGRSAAALMQMVVAGYRASGKATAHDQVVSAALAQVLSGGDTDVTTPLGESQMLDLERSAFMDSIRTPDTLARMQHMLESGKPLRN